MKELALLLAAVAAVTSVPQPEGVQLWQDYKVQFGKAYDQADEDLQRMEIFLGRAKEVEEHNAKYDAGLVSYKKRITKFSDMTAEEFVEAIRCVNLDEPVSSQKVFVAPPDAALPSFVDWRAEGAVTEVKDQGRCGSCWAFSTTGSLEGQLFRKTKKLVSLSEQNLVDCSYKYGNGGCSGGNAVQAFKYIKENRGIDSEESYRYTGMNGNCHYKPQYSAGTTTGLVEVKSGDEQALKAAVAKIGPVSVAIDAIVFLDYHSGVINSPNCSKTPNHAVVVVGYGTTEQGVDYWIVKNSWGKYFGMDGYAFMSRNKDNQCAIASYCHYPTV